MARMITLIDQQLTYEPVTVAPEDVASTLRPWCEPWGHSWTMAEDVGAALAADDDATARARRLPRHRL